MTTQINNKAEKMKTSCLSCRMFSCPFAGQNSEKCRDWTQDTTPAKWDNDNGYNEIERD